METHLSAERAAVLAKSSQVSVWVSFSYSAPLVWNLRFPLDLRRQAPAADHALISDSDYSDISDCLDNAVNEGFDALLTLKITEVPTTATKRGRDHRGQTWTPKHDGPPARRPLTGHARTPKHDGPPARRPLTGHARLTASQATVDVGAYNVRRVCLNKADERYLEEGDFKGVPSLEVLRKAATGSQVLRRFNADAFHVLLTMHPRIHATTHNVRTYLLPFFLGTSTASARNHSFRGSCLQREDVQEIQTESEALPIHVDDTWPFVRKAG